VNINDKLIGKQFAPAGAEVSVGGVQPYVPTPFDITTAQAVFADLAKRISDLEGQIKLQVPSDGVLSAITISKEAILIESDKIGVLGQVTFADYIRTQSGKPLVGAPIDPSITRIIGGVIQTGKIENLATTSYVNLDAVTTGQIFIQCASAISIYADGQFVFGPSGDATKQLTWNNSSLSVGGNTLLNGTATSTVVTGAANGAAAIAGLADKLSKSAGDILSGSITVQTAGGISTGTITWDGAGNLTGGSGVAITAKGIVGAASGVATFSINGSTGAAIFKGSVDAATVTSGGITVNGSINVSTSGSIYSGQSTYNSGTGWHFDYNAGSPRMSIGDSSTKSLTWDTGSGLFTINSGVLLGSTSVSTTVAGALAGASALQANSTYTLAGTEQLNGTGGILAGSVTWNSSTGAITGGTGGIVLTKAGIMGWNGSAITFSIDGSTGAAAFAGSLSAATGTFAGALSAATGTFAGALSAATGTFAGNLTSGGNVDVTGYVHATGARSEGAYNNCVAGVTTTSGYNGVLGIATSGYGVVGQATTGYGVVGNTTAGGTGVRGTAVASGVAVSAGGALGATALQVLGPMTIDNTNQVSNLFSTYAVYLWDGSYSHFFSGVATTGTSTVVATLTNKPGASTSTNKWVKYYDGASYWQIPAWAD
jgi:hypothetical protein